MSLEQLKDFLLRMQQDGALKQQVLSAATADDVAQIARNSAMSFLETSFYELQASGLIG